MKISDSVARRLPSLPKSQPVAAPKAPQQTVALSAPKSTFSAAAGDPNARALLGLKRGTVSTDGRIKQLQDDLMRMGYLQDIHSNSGYGNTFGPMTEAAVKKLQADKGLPVTGRVDAATVDVLLGAHQPPPVVTPPPAPIPGTQYPGAPAGDPNAANVVGLQRNMGTPAQVKQVQDDLINMGYLDPSMRQNSGYGNTFGPKTEAAMKAFQQDNGLPPTGVIDAATAQALAGPRPRPAPIAAGAAAAYRDQLGLPNAAPETLPDGSVKQSFDKGYVLASADGMLYVRTNAGADIAPPQKLGAATSVQEANQHFLSQWGPTPWNSAQGAPYGYEDCGPTSVAMALSSLGLMEHPSPADAEKVIDAMRDQALGYDSNHSQGTGDGQLIRALAGNGANTNVLRPITLDKMDAAIAAGHPLILGTSTTWEAWGKTQSAAGDYLNHRNPGGHFVTVLGKAPNGNYIVGDPLSKTGAVEVTPQQMQTALGGAWDAIEISRK